MLWEFLHGNFFFISSDFCLSLLSETVYLLFKHVIALEADHSPPSSSELQLRIHGAVPPPSHIS
jgi:hypothetical protein